VRSDHVPDRMAQQRTKKTLHGEGASLHSKGAAIRKSRLTRGCSRWLRSE
jgi:hypothetical protein